MSDVRKSVRNAALSPIQRLLRDFGRRHTALDYAFFKLNLPEQNVALLVDFIVRRRRRIAQVRVSAHAPEGSGVYLAEHPLERLAVASSSADACAVSLGDCWLGATGSRGAVAAAAWDLTFHPTGPLVSPLISIAEPFNPFDLSLQTVPNVRFSGTITIAGQTYDAQDAHGMVSSYAGRALPERWFWFSCNTFDREDLVVELFGLTHRAVWIASASEVRLFLPVYRRSDGVDSRPAKRLDSAGGNARSDLHHGAAVWWGALRPTRGGGATGLPRSRRPYLEYPHRLMHSRRVRRRARQRIVGGAHVTIALTLRACSV
jgi:hypothetical protein